MGVTDGKTDGHRLAARQSLPRVLQQLPVERVFQAVVLLDQAAPAYAGGYVGIEEHRGKIQAAGLPMIHVLALSKAIRPADHFVNGAEAELRHDLPQVFRQVKKEIDYVLGLALELLAQFGVLRGHADGAGVQVALAHHDATE